MVLRLVLEPPERDDELLQRGDQPLVVVVVEDGDVASAIGVTVVVGGGGHRPPPAAVRGRSLLSLHPLHWAVQVVQDPLHVSLAQHLQLQVLSVVQLHLGVSDALVHLPQRERQVEATLGHAAEVDGEVGAAGARLVDGQQQVVRVLALVAEQLELGQDDLLAPDTVVMRQGQLERAGVLQQVDLELVVYVGEVDEEDGVRVDGVEGTFPNPLQDELQVVMADDALKLAVLCSEDRTIFLMSRINF